MKRKHGSANVEEHPKGSGLYRVRARIGGKLVTVASKLNESAAQATADTYAEIRSAKELQHGITVAQFGGGFLDRREARGIRSMQQDRARWRNYVEEDPMGRIAIAYLRRRDLVEWRDRMIGRGLARQTVKNAINLLRTALSEALDRELVEANVARDLTVPRSVSGHRSHEDLTGILSPAEQIAVLNAAPERDRHLVLFALSTGVRWSEQSWLRWTDVSEESVTIRLSRNGMATKTGAARTIPLFGPAKEALAVARAKRARGCKWVFPSVTGEPRQQRPNGWLSWVKAAKVDRRVRWHDLRHTCATALLAGWWSERRWTLPEIARLLGHEEISTTERYAKKLDETLFAAAARMRFPEGNSMFSNIENLLANPNFPKPKIASSNLAGGALEKLLVATVAGSTAGTPRELPKALKIGLRKTSPRTREGSLVRRMARAAEAVLAGDRDRAVGELRKATESLPAARAGGVR